MSNLTLFTSECVSMSHPDKLCDFIADTLKDRILREDPKAHIAIEVAVTTQFCLLMGEVTTNATIDYEGITREAIRENGYVFENEGFDYESVEILNKIHAQSEDINMGTKDEVGGAGDQGIIFGYACDETPELMPLTMVLSRDLTNRAHHLCQTDPKHLLRPDSKAQVTVSYNESGVAGIDTIVVSSAHADAPIEDVRDYILKNVIFDVLKNHNIDIESIKNIHINPTGRFVTYGPDGDSGLTGRKLVVDQYGGHSAVGGGTMQGKDPSKVDNSAALMARYIAKNVVAAGLARKCQVQLAYAIGIPEPVSININTFGTGLFMDSTISEWVSEVFDCRPLEIIKTLDLRNPDKWSYADASASGWFGRNHFPWESTDKAKELADRVR